jgi:hypothetical protein
MKWLKTGGMVAIFGMVVCADSGAQTADKFRRINDSQIRAQFTGMELSDGTHWVDIFAAGGGRRAAVLHLTQWARRGSASGA